MKKLLMLLMLLPAILMVAACENPDTKDKVVIDFWHMSPVGSPTFSKMRAIVNEFNNSQDEYFVKGTGLTYPRQTDEPDKRWQPKNPDILSIFRYGRISVSPC